MSRRCASSKPTPAPLNGLAMKPGETRRKEIEENGDTITRQTTRQKPAAYRHCVGGGGGEEGAMARQTAVETLPRTVSLAGGRDEKGELKENTGAKTREPFFPSCGRRRL